MQTLSIDIETFSTTDLTKSGVYRYVEDSNFQILLFGYSVDHGPVRVVDLASCEKLPADIIAALDNPSVIKWAFNAQFERTCLSKLVGHQLVPEGWHCTMIWAATLGLPLSLEAVGTVLGLEKQKLKEGKDLIRYFCVPCKATKTNDGRTRNYPINDKEKWELFKSYNVRDVETELAIQDKLARFPVSEYVWKQYHLDQQINDAGIALDMELVEKAIACDKAFKKKHMDRARLLTGLENPNSPIQLKEWLESKGVTVDSLAKAAVKEMLAEADGEVEEVLQLRQLLAKSSVKKYAAMEHAVCHDGRARGLIQFYGANRTGRYSGRLVQVQNLPQNHISDLKVARELIKTGDFEGAELLYDSVPNVLSELIRTAFVPKPSYKFLVADFSAIEARVIAWLAGEKWRIGIVMLVYMTAIVVYMQRSYKAMQKLGTQDQTTGLQNRNLYDAHVEQWKTKCFRQINCVYIDANGLHEINNKYGHNAGDEMLKTIANALKYEFGYHQLYRIGGDEFVVLDEDSDYEVCMEKVRTVQATIESCGYSIAVGTVSFQNETGLNRIIREADEKMLENKREYYKTHDRRNAR